MLVSTTPGVGLVVPAVRLLAGQNRRSSGGHCALETQDQLTLDIASESEDSDLLMATPSVSW